MSQKALLWRVCVSHVSLVHSRNHCTSPFNAVPWEEQRFMIGVCSTYSQVCLPSFRIVLSLQAQELSQEKEAIKLKTTLKQSKKNFLAVCLYIPESNFLKISFIFMLYMNVLHTCLYVYAPCMNLIECLDLELQIVVSHNVDVETWTLALWKNQQLLFSSLENNF